ncbi:hypothetical protein CCH79_00014163 [Gambusia affinis]|uniref:Pentraxin (PTX) domain-containing protein n=1 Tax=Gambusia affinis TaxID=33528 RepID=A0A315WB37_GAMAF|nr:hypothetical protein CCH79_00014163 [Gambusia affinis]
MARDNSLLSLMPSPVRYKQRCGPPLGLILHLSPLHSLIFYYFLSCAAAAGTIEYDYGISPKFVCTPVPPEADPSCYSPPSVPHGPSSSSHGTDHSTGNHRGIMSDEAKATILHLRESLVRQKETILDQRETIRELTAKLTLCEGFGGHHNIGHHESHHGYHDNHHDTHHSSHQDNHNSHHGEHHGHHGSHHGPSSLHHGPSAHHGSDHHSSHGSHRSDLHHQKGSSYGKHSSFSPEQTGKTLQILKERLENLQARNSSSSYSSSLRELLQRKINALEEQLHKINIMTTMLITMMTCIMITTAAATMMTTILLTMVAILTIVTMIATIAVVTMKTITEATMVAIDTTITATNIVAIMTPTMAGIVVITMVTMKTITAATTMTIIMTTMVTIMVVMIAILATIILSMDLDIMMTIMMITMALKTMSTIMKGSTHPGAFLTLARKQVCGALATASWKQFSANYITMTMSFLPILPGNQKKLKSPSAFLLEFPMRTNYMYARMKRSVVNEIFALTICLWLKPGEGSNLGTPISYAVPGQANELVLMEWGSNPMELLINDKAVTVPITLTDGKWHHVCVTWSTHDGVWEAYQDGVKKGSGQNLSAWNPIKPGGIFMLGQEQDTMGGRFDITQSFLGELSDLQFWSRVLTANEIHTQATCGSHLVGDVMSWSEEQVELHGGLTELPFEPCH